MRIFIDSNVFIALANDNDPFHVKAIKISEHIFNSNHKLFVSNLILFESATVISLRVGKIQALTFFDNFPKDIQIIKLEDTIEKNSWTIFHKIKDKNVSMVDCTSFYIIEKYKIDRAFTFDKDFEKYGMNVIESGL